MTRVTRNTLKIGLPVERHERGAPRERGEIVNLHRKDRTAEVRIDGQRREIPMAQLAKHWRVAA